jgi:hypothetical protein
MTVVDTKLNLLGGDNVTFVGTNLPRDLSQSTVTITFNDNQGTLCVPNLMATTELICTTNAFTSSDTSTTMTPVIVINSQTVSHSLSLQTKPSVMAVTSMSPTVANPVLNTDVTLTITSTFPYTLNRDDFTFEAEDTNNTNYRRQLKVNTVDDSAKTLTGKF